MLQENPSPRKHETVNHLEREYSRNGVALTLLRMFGLLKRFIVELVSQGKCEAFRRLFRRLEWSLIIG
jgi:hypothetical protein